MSNKESQNKKNAKLMTLSPKGGVYDPVVADEAERDALFTGNVQDGFKVRIASLGVTQEWNNGQAQWETQITTGNPATVGMQETYDVNPEINLDLQKPILINSQCPDGPTIDAYDAKAGGASDAFDNIQGWTFNVSETVFVNALTYVDANFTQPGVRDFTIYRKSDEAVIIKGGIFKTDPLVSGFRENTSITIVADNGFLFPGIDYVIAGPVPANESYLTTSTTTNAIINVIEKAEGPASSVPAFPQTFTPIADCPVAGGFRFQTVASMQNYVIDSMAFVQKMGSTGFNTMMLDGEFVIFGTSPSPLMQANYSSNEVRFNGTTKLNGVDNQINGFLTQTAGYSLFNAAQDSPAGGRFAVSTNATANAIFTDYDDDRTLVQHELRFTTLTPNTPLFTGPSGEVGTVDFTGDASSALNVLTLATVNANTGTLGGPGKSLQVDLDGKGRVTAASESVIPDTPLQLAFEAGNTIATDEVTSLTVKTPFPTFGSEQLGFTGGVSVSSDGVPTIYGWRFQITKRIKVKALGYYDANFTEAGSRDVVIYNYVGTPGPGTEATPVATILKTDPLDSGWRKKSIAETILEPGEYVMAATVPANENHFTGDTQVASPDIIPIGLAFYNNSPSLIYPVVYNTTSDQLTAGNMFFEAEELVDTDALVVNPVTNEIDSYRTLNMKSNSISNLNKIEGNLDVTGDTLIYSGDVVGPSYIPKNCLRAISDGAINTYDVLTASTTTPFRVVALPTGASDSTGVIGFAGSSAAGAGEEIIVYNASMATVQSDSISVIALSDPIEKSDTDVGRVQNTAVSPGTFGIAAEAAAVNTIFNIWISKNELF